MKGECPREAVNPTNGDLGSRIMNIPCKGYSSDSACSPDEGYQDGHRDARHAAAELVAESRSDTGGEWIKCSERLPDNKELDTDQYLVKYNYGLAYTRWFRDGKWYETLGDMILEGHIPDSRIVEWMVIPPTGGNFTCAWRESNEWCQADSVMPMLETECGHTTDSDREKGDPCDYCGRPISVEGEEK